MEETLNQEKLKGKSFEEASFPALVMDKKGTVKAANTELAKLLGYNKDDMPEKGAEDLVDAGELKLTQMGSGSVTLKASDGKEVPSEVEVADFELDGTEHYAAYFREKEEA
jgi:PAS domain S-box-containing protein